MTTSDADRTSPRAALGVLVALLGLALGGCRGHEPAYAPGLGEIMTLQQMRHTKLWLAGEAGNWELARYEVEELGEGFDDVVRFHPTHKDAPARPKDLVPVMTRDPLAQLRAAVDRRDPAAFAKGYDALTAACNSCHRAMSFGFNVVQRPAANPYPDQSFGLQR